MLQGNREQNLVNTIVEASQQDAQLAKLLENAIDYAQIYILAKERQKGCDEMGEVAMIKDELSYSIDSIIQYCQIKGHLSCDNSYDINVVSYELSTLRKME